MLATLHPYNHSDSALQNGTRSCWRSRLWILVGMLYLVAAYLWSHPTRKAMD